MCTVCGSPWISHAPTRLPSRRTALRLIGAVAVAPALAGCDQVSSWLVSDQAIEELGLETWRRLRSQMQPLRDAAVQRQVEGIVERLLTANGDNPSRWEVQVFADPGVNAFVLPGRRIGVLQGMLGVAEDEAQLAAVIGHEIGHLAADHSRERVSAEVLQQWGLRLISFALQINDVAFAQEIAALLGVGVEFGVLRPYGRSQELEADRLGLFMMAKAGYDPRQAAELWRRMDAASGNRVPAFLSTHPAPEARIRAIESLIPEALAAART